MSRRPSLRRAEADERSGLVRDVRAEVELDLTGDRDTFSSRTRLVFNATAGSDTFIECDGADVQAVLNGTPIPDAAIEGGRIHLDGLQCENTLDVVATMHYSHDGEGLHRHQDAGDGQTYLYAMSFLDAAPRWITCFDQPDIKARHRFRVLAPADWIVRGNAPVESHTERAGRTEWVLGWTEPIPSYTTTLVAGPWATIAGDHDGVRLELLARRSMTAELERAATDLLEVTAECLDAYHDLFAIRYPFGDYVQAFVPDFNAGAMENPGCVLVREQMLFRGAVTRAELDSRAGLVAHEMAHQWFGDLVTMRWWDDLWLNESFAEYLAHRVITASGRTNLWVDFGVNRKNWGSEADQGPGSHPIAGNGSDDARTALENFDGISYAKGAAVLRQLVARMGDEVFLAGLRRYVELFQFGNARAQDLLDCWTHAGAEGLEQWSRQWLTTQDLDLISVDADHVVRQVPLEHPADRDHALELAAFDAHGVEQGRIPLVVGCQRTEHPFIHADLLIPDAGDQTWARVRPSVSLGQLPALSRFADPSVRVVLLNALRDGVRHAELSPRAALSSIIAALPGEADATIAAAMLSWALDLSGDWLAPAERTEGREELAAASAELVASAPAGSDLQLSAFRALLRTTRDREQLTAWLEEQDLPQGIGLDQELRWLGVHRLIMLGAGTEIIDAEYARDHTSTGLLRMRGVQTAVPTEEAKRAALEVLIGSSDLGNHELQAIAQNLFLPEHAHLTDGLVEPWLSGMIASARHRQGWMVPRLVQASAPTSHASAEVDLRLRAALASDDVPALVQRPLQEALRRVEQIMAARMARSDL